MIEPHQQRVIDEKTQLDDRLYKLADFLDGETFKTLPFDERQRLRDQHNAMHTYASILGQRIEHFNGAKVVLVQNSDGVLAGTIDTNNGIALGAATNILWGVGQLNESMLPVKNVPPGEQRIVVAMKQPGKLYIKTTNSVRCFLLFIDQTDGKLFIKPEMERKGIYSFPEMELP